MKRQIDILREAISEYEEAFGRYRQILIRKTYLKLLWYQCKVLKGPADNGHVCIDLERVRILDDLNADFIIL